MTAPAAPVGTAPRWLDLTAPDIAALPPDTVAVLPLGAVEQHGPHLPVSTDLVVASAAAEVAVDAVAAAGSASTVLLPPLAFTKSDEHAWSPGTVWLSAATLLAVLGDVGRSLATSGITRLLFVNGHGGNSALGQVACRQLRRDHGLRTFFAHPSVPPDQGGRPAAGTPADELGMGVHGGHSETSVMLHLRPDLVRMDLAERCVPEALADFRLIGFGKPVSFGWTSDDFGPSGVIGDPTGASAEAGAALFAAACAQLADVVVEASRFPGDAGR